MLILYDFVKVLLAVFLLGLSTERGVQLVKEFLRSLEPKFPKLKVVRDSRTYLLAAVLIFGVCYLFGVDITGMLPAFKDVFAGEPKLEFLVNFLLLLGGATWSHDKIFKKK